MKMNLPKTLLCIALAPLFLATHAVGALITWDATATSVNPLDPTQVSNNGSLVVAEFMAYSPTLTLDINGVHFVDWQVATHITNVLSGNGAGYITAANDYETLLNGGLYLVNSATPPAIVLSNLTDGQSYEIQVWTPYWDTLAYSTRFSSSAPDGATSATAPNQSPTLQLGLTGGARPVSQPQFIKGTFTAVGTTQNLYYFGDSSIGIVGALQVRAVPEPTTFAFLALGGLALVMRSRFRQRILTA